ncbi:MAG: hypothetical protein IKH90_04880 [Ruminococcus sp.]|nr:hypothetical protein [Ruminococcus sp.]
MTKDEALKIVNDNYAAANDSFLFYLHERDRFRADRFNTLCKAVDALAGSRCEMLTEKITHCYQNILKEFIYHFNPNDSSQIRDFPKHYTHYLEKFDCALARYYTCGNKQNEKER